MSTSDATARETPAVKIHWNCVSIILEHLTVYKPEYALESLRKSRLKCYKLGWVITSRTREYLRFDRCRYEYNQMLFTIQNQITYSIHKLYNARSDKKWGSLAGIDKWSLPSRATSKRAYGKRRRLLDKLNVMGLTNIDGIITFPRLTVQ